MSVMESKEMQARAYVKRRFTRASVGEQEKIVRDWLTKDLSAAGIAADFEQRIQPLQGLKVLDAGSGNGGIGIAFAKRGAAVEGVDVEEELVAIARAAASACGSNAKFTWYEGSTLPFSDKLFDAALSVSVIEHVDSPVRYLTEILRVLKPGGYLYLAFPNRLYPKETHTGLWGLSYLPIPLARLYVRIAKRNPLEDNGLHFYSYWDIRRFLNAAAVEGRSLIVQEEQGRGTSLPKRLVKQVLRMLGIPHQAFLPHVMLALKAS